jgi:predicted aspartyl protease
VRDGGFRPAATHSVRRSRRSLAAPLDDLPGIGPVAAPVAPAAPPVTISNAIEVPFTRNNGGTIEVPVTINGSERAIFIVDSGASDVVIPRTAR